MHILGGNSPEIVVVDEYKTNSHEICYPDLGTHILLVLAHIFHIHKNNLIGSLLDIDMNNNLENIHSVKWP